MIKPFSQIRLLRCGFLVTTIAALSAASVSRAQSCAFPNCTNSPASDVCVSCSGQYCPGGMITSCNQYDDDWNCISWAQPYCPVYYYWSCKYVGSCVKVTLDKSASAQDVTTISISVAGLNGFDGGATVKVSGLPPGSSFLLPAATVTPPASLPLTLYAGTAAKGTYSVQVTVFPNGFATWSTATFTWTILHGSARTISAIAPILLQ
jgi:hypothetical protein